MSRRPHEISDPDLLERSRDAALDALVLQLRVLHEAKARPCPEPPGPCSAAPVAPNPRAVHAAANEFLRDLARFSLRAHEEWLRFANRSFSHIVDQVHGSEPEVQVLPLHLAGTVANVATGVFVVTNPFQRRARLRFGVAEFIADDGQHRLDSRVIFTRVRRTGAHEAGSDFVLAGHGEGRFQIAVPLRADAVKVHYVADCPVIVDGCTAARLRVSLTVS